MQQHEQGTSIKPKRLNITDAECVLTFSDKWQLKEEEWGYRVCTGTTSQRAPEDVELQLAAVPKSLRR
jgi:hypothetical protein